MTCTIRIVTGALGPTALDGMYLRSYDPEACDGRGCIVATPDRANALRFIDAADAMALYRLAPKCHPIRESDGKPNRPLTAYTIEIEYCDG